MTPELAALCADLLLKASHATQGRWYPYWQYKKLPDNGSMIAATAPGHQVRTDAPGGMHPSQDLEHIAACSPENIRTLVAALEAADQERAMPGELDALVQDVRRRVASGESITATETIEIAQIATQIVEAVTALKAQRDEAIRQRDEARADAKMTTLREVSEAIGAPFVFDADGIAAFERGRRAELERQRDESDAALVRLADWARHLDSFPDVLATFKAARARQASRAKENA